LAKHYRRPVVATGPIFRSLEKKAGALRLHFDPAGWNLVVQGNTPGEFAIAGADKKWHRATAKIDGETIVVSAPEVSTPVAVRYAWQANPVATLFNTAGLPAAPFRTDDWPLDPGN
jgi:sialate O-acetylesterase